MPNPVNETGNFRNISADTAVYSGACQLLGIFCSTSSAATVIVYDNTAASGSKIVNGMTLAGGVYYPLPASCVNGIYVDVTGTCDITVFFVPG